MTQDDAKNPDMAYEQSPPFYPIAIHITVITQMLPVFWISLYYLNTGKSLFHWLVPVMLVIALFGMKISAPRIPWKQLLMAMLTVFVTSITIDSLALHFTPLIFFIGNAIIPITCVFGFGKYWVRNRYIPQRSNW